MKTTKRILITILLISVLPVLVQAKSWRGISPLHSTREDVEKLLGPPPPPPSDGSRSYKLSKTRSIYFLEEGEVYIVFAEKEFSTIVSCVNNIPAGTVLLIAITPKRKLRLSELRVDEKRFRVFDPSSPPNIGFKAYADDEEGWSIRTQAEMVELINYYAAAEDAHLCSEYYSGQKRFCDILVDFIRE